MHKKTNSFFLMLYDTNIVIERDIKFLYLTMVDTRWPCYVDSNYFVEFQNKNMYRLDV